MTNVMPTAIIPAGAHCDSMLKMFCADRKAGLPMPTTATSSTKVRMMP